MTEEQLETEATRIAIEVVKDSLHELRGEKFVCMTVYEMHNVTEPAHMDLICAKVKAITDDLLGYFTEPAANE